MDTEKTIRFKSCNYCVAKVGYDPGDSEMANEAQRWLVAHTEVWHAEEDAGMLQVGCEICGHFDCEHLGGKDGDTAS